MRQTPLHAGRIHLSIAIRTNRQVLDAVPDCGHHYVVGVASQFHVDGDGVPSALETDPVSRPWHWPSPQAADCQHTHTYQARNRPGGRPGAELETSEPTVGPHLQQGSQRQLRAHRAHDRRRHRRRCHRRRGLPAVAVAAAALAAAVVHQP
eukprot:1677393-Prymnesium_polylepis.4